MSVAYLNAVRQDPCAYCGARADHLDHVVPKVRGGADTWDNLTATCKPCNSAKTSRSLLGFLGLRRLAAETAWVAPTRSLWSGVGR